MQTSERFRYNFRPWYWHIYGCLTLKTDNFHDAVFIVACEDQMNWYHDSVFSEEWISSYDCCLTCMQYARFKLHFFRTYHGLSLHSWKARTDLEALRFLTLLFHDTWYEWNGYFYGLGFSKKIVRFRWWFGTIKLSIIVMLAVLSSFCNGTAMDGVTLWCYLQCFARFQLR